MWDVGALRPILGSLVEIENIDAPRPILGSLGGILVPPDPFWGPHLGFLCPQTHFGVFSGDFGVPIRDVGAPRPILGSP